MCFVIGQSDCDKDRSSEIDKLMSMRNKLPEHFTKFPVKREFREVSYYYCEKQQNSQRVNLKVGVYSANASSVFYTLHQGF